MSKGQTIEDVDLRLGRLRHFNVMRQIEWRNGSTAEIPASFSAMELAGEVGEACNEVKKLERARLGLVGGKTDLSGLEDELADVVICTDLLAMEYGIDLAAAVRKKFNKTSAKYGLSTL